MRKLMRVATLAVAVIVALQGCAALYSAEAIDARVIDAETREPLEGVIVIANWYLSYGIEGTQEANLKLVETVSDRQGRFQFPPWGPEPVPEHLPWGTTMRNSNPELILFKSGYEWIAIGNDVLRPDTSPGSALRTSDWNGKTFEIRRFKGDKKQYASYLGGILSGVNYGQCRWKNIPRLIVALNLAAVEYDRERIHYILPTYRHLENSSAGENCGSVRGYFEAYQP